MALTLLSQTRDPYQTAFAAQQGAHLQVAYDSRSDPQTIAATPQLLGATASGGPYPVTSLQFQAGSRKFGLDTIGRDDPGGGEPDGIRIRQAHLSLREGEVAARRVGP